MLTPQEVAEHAFAKATFGGYNMGMVDEFLDLLTNDYTTLYKENTGLKAKMKILADKVEEYRATDDAMRHALLSAQKMADQMVSEAEAKKASLLAEAENEAREKLAGLRKEAENERLRLAAARTETAAYIEKLKALYQHELDYIASLSGMEAPEPPVDTVAQTADQIGEAVAQAVAEEIPMDAVPAAPAAPVQEPVAPDIPVAPAAPVMPPMPQAAPAPEGNLYEELTRGTHDESTETVMPSESVDDSPTQRIDLSNLKFGSNYKLQ